jgi:hypothetical protein
MVAATVAASVTETVTTCEECCNHYSDQLCYGSRELPSNLRLDSATAFSVVNACCHFGATSQLAGNVWKAAMAHWQAGTLTSKAGSCVSDQCASGKLA